jgi:hypothetical protein
MIKPTTKSHEKYNEKYEWMKDIMIRVAAKFQVEENFVLSVSFIRNFLFLKTFHVTVLSITFFNLKLFMNIVYCVMCPFIFFLLIFHAFFSKLIITRASEYMRGCGNT